MIPMHGTRTAAALIAAFLLALPAADAASAATVHAAGTEGTRPAWAKADNLAGSVAGSVVLERLGLVLARSPERQRAYDAYLDALYRRADVYVQPAENSGGAFEGFGLTYLEANAYGKPVIGTLECGAEDAITDGENGYLVPQRDPAAVAGALLRLLADPAAARLMGERGRQRALSRDWSSVVGEYLEIYRRVLGR